VQLRRKITRGFQKTSGLRRAEDLQSVTEAFINTLTSQISGHDPRN
jgi:hypothetical protein